MSAIGSVHDISFRSTILLIFSIIVVILIFQGISIIDTDAPEVWRAMLGVPFQGDPKRLYLAEGLVSNALGIALLGLKLSDRVTLLLWWSLGVGLLACSIVFSVRDGTIKLLDLLLIITFSRLVDTLTLWIGKFDPFLLSFLILSANRRPAVSRISIALAALCHPLAAVVSAFGNATVLLAFKTRVDRLLPVIALVFAGCDFALAHTLVAGMVDRGGFFLTTLQTVLISGAECGLITFVSTFVLPYLFITRGEAATTLSFQSHVLPLMAWLACAAVIASLLTLDHTRVACLITMSPMITFLRIKRSRVPLPSDRVRLPPDFFLLATARLVIPHIAGDGFWLFNWKAIGKILGAAFHIQPH